MPQDKYDAVILGAGVIGLSVALVLHQRGLRVAIIARDLPSDTKSVAFASPWAGCNWYPFDDSPDTPSSRREVVTFSYLDRLSKSNPELCGRLPFYSVWDLPKPADQEELWFRDIVGDYKRIDTDIPGGKKNARTWTSFVLHAPLYIQHLSTLLQEASVPILRANLTSLDDAHRIAGPSKVVINALGLGARWLKGVADPKVYAARGQTLLVRAKGWERRCVMHVEGFNAGSGRDLPEPAYIIPRPGNDSQFIIGGTYLINNHNTDPDPIVADRILRDCINLMETSGSKTGGKQSEVEVISHNVGLRPAREGGARLEIDRETMRTGNARVIHAYGFGSAGYQQGWGAAQEVAALVDQVLAHDRASL